MFYTSRATCKPIFSVYETHEERGSGFRITKPKMQTWFSLWDFVVSGGRVRG